MVKPKRRPSMAVSENNFSTEWNEDESWVIVKKQKVTILVPLLPSAKKSTMPNLEPSQLQPMPTKPLDKQSQHSNEAHSKKVSVAEQEKLTSLAPNRGFQIAKRTPSQYIATIARPPIIGSMMMEPENVGGAHDKKVTKPHEIIEVLDTSKVMRRPRSLHGISGSLDRSMLLNQRLRALNLERKLRKASGSSRLGLRQFIWLYQGKSVNKFQSVNLTVQKLKDLGADAVGLGRKLLHAIECVCQPYCFATS